MLVPAGGLQTFAPKLISAWLYSPWMHMMWKLLVFLLRTGMVFGLRLYVFVCWVINILEWGEAGFFPTILSPLMICHLIPASAQDEGENKTFPSPPRVLGMREISLEGKNQTFHRSLLALRRFVGEMVTSVLVHPPRKNVSPSSSVPCCHHSRPNRRGDNINSWRLSSGSKNKVRARRK